MGSRIEETLLRYIDTVFYLRDGSLRQERRRLLSGEVLLVPSPLLEPVLPYDGVVDAVEACTAVGLEPHEAAWLVEGLFGASAGGPASGGTRPKHSASRCGRAVSPTRSSRRGRGLERRSPSSCQSLRDCCSSHVSGPRSQVLLSTGGTATHCVGDPCVRRTATLQYGPSSSIRRTRSSRTRCPGSGARRDASMTLVDRGSGSGDTRPRLWVGPGCLL